MKINGECLKAHRSYQGLTQSALARLSGVAQSHISAIEAGLKTEVRPPTVRKLALALNVSMSELCLDPAPPRRLSGARRDSA